MRILRYFFAISLWGIIAGQAVCGQDLLSMDPVQSQARIDQITASSYRVSEMIVHLTQFKILLNELGRDDLVGDARAQVLNNARVYQNFYADFAIKPEIIAIFQAEDISFNTFIENIWLLATVNLDDKTPFFSVADACHDIVAANNLLIEKWMGELNIFKASLKLFVAQKKEATEGESYFRRAVFQLFQEAVNSINLLCSECCRDAGILIFFKYSQQLIQSLEPIQWEDRRSLADFKPRVNLSPTLGCTTKEQLMETQAYYRAWLNNVECFP